MQQRSGSAPAACSSSTNAPACTLRLTHPSTGIAAEVAIDPRLEVVQHRLEAAEVGRHEVDRRAGVAQEPLGRTEEAAAVVHPRAHEQLVQVGEQRAEHLEVLEVVALAERVEEASGHAGARAGRRACRWGGSPRRPRSSDWNMPPLCAGEPVRAKGRTY